MSDITKIIDTKQETRTVKAVAICSHIEQCPIIDVYRTVVLLKEAEALPVSIWMCLGAFEHNTPNRYCRPNCPFYHTVFIRGKTEEPTDGENPI